MDCSRVSTRNTVSIKFHFGSKSESMSESGRTEAAVAGAVTQSAVAAGTVVRPVAGAVVAGSVMTESVAGKAAVPAVVAVSAVSTETAVAAVTSETAELPFFRLFGRGPGRYQRHGQSEEDDLKQLTRDQDHLRGWLVHS